MVSEMENEQVEEMDIEVLHSMWPEDMNEAGKQFNVEKPRGDQDMLEEVTIIEEPTIVDFERLVELTNYSERGSSQLAYLVNNWELKQANAARLLKEELDTLSRQQHEVELKKLEILEEHRFVDEKYEGDKRPISILDGVNYDIWQTVPRRKKDVVILDKRVVIDAEYDTVKYWKQRAMNLEILLEASIQREQILQEKLQESIENLERQSSPVEELSQVLKRADNFLHFVLQNAPVVIGHQDKELRYRFIYNHFPRFREEDIIGKTDMEIFTGAGVKESQDFKREVLEKGKPAKREITFETELFGYKTFLIYVEPVFSKAGETIGINYMGMEVTDQVEKREKMAKLREEIAVQKAKETELNKTIHITEETMRAKQMLATMSHEIRSPLSGVVSMAEILSRTQLNKDQKQLLRVMLSSGDLVLQLINDILDLSKVESGVMKLEATKFRPREVVKHVLQTAAASLQKMLILEGNIEEDIPIEVIGDVLRIRQILTNLISNAVKFTPKGKVGIKLSVVPEPCQSTVSASKQKEDKKLLYKQSSGDRKRLYEHNALSGEQEMGLKEEVPVDGDKGNELQSRETKVWIRCDVYDTGIGIPESALPNLFKKYMQAGADTARKYGGTGLGLAICKQLVELMGGQLTVSSKEHHGSRFTFVLPYKVSPVCDSSDDPDELSDMTGYDAGEDDTTSGFFQFKPLALSSLLSSKASVRTHQSTNTNSGFNAVSKINGLSEDHSFPLDKVTSIYSAETVSEPETSTRWGPEKSCTDTNHVAKSMDARTDEIRETEVKSDRGSECSTSNNLEFTTNTAVKVKPNILLAEDNKINVMVARSMMKQLGYDIHVVSNGVEAVRAVQRGGYNIILMDVCMPVMDGLQATRLIRSFEETGNWDVATNAGVEQHKSPSGSMTHGQEIDHPTKRIPIIAMTANAMSESGEECFANGMDSFVSKPITFQKLKQCLEQYLL